MSRLAKVILIAFVAVVTLVPAASTASAARIIVGGGFYGPVWGPAWGPGWYGPPYGYGRFVPNAGQVKIVTRSKGNAVYVDGGYAGVTGKLKKFPLRPGNHTIAFKDSDGRTFYQERIEVLLGKTIEVHPDSPYRG